MRRHGFILSQGGKSSSGAKREEKCSLYFFGDGEQIKQIKVGWDRVLKRFTYLKMQTSWNPGNIYGQLTPSADVSTVAIDYNLVGFKTTSLFDPLSNQGFLATI